MIFGLFARLGDLTGASRERKAQPIARVNDIHKCPLRGMGEHAACDAALILGAGKWT